jgi:hypothetical protein
MSSRKELDGIFSTTSFHGRLFGQFKLKQLLHKLKLKGTGLAVVGGGENIGMAMAIVFCRAMVGEFL